jgi:hypothetical protein
VEHGAAVPGNVFLTFSGVDLMNTFGQKFHNFFYFMNLLHLKLPFHHF